MTQRDLDTLDGLRSPEPLPHWAREIRFLKGLLVMAVMFLFTFGLNGLFGGL